MVISIGSYLAFTDINPDPNIVEYEPGPEEWVLDHSLATYLEEFERDFEVGLNEGRV